MGRVYSYLRFSDPTQAAGSSADRQTEYAQRWAEARGLVLDAALSMRDEGLSGYHERHVTRGALGVFLRAVEDGRIEDGSVLIVEAFDRLSRAEPLKAQAQLTQIIHAGIKVVTAVDGQEYSLETIRANPYKLIHSLVMMILAHEESDNKSRRVRAAIRRQCEGWQAGTWRGVIRNGKDPQWVKWNGQAFELVPERAEAVRYAVRRFVDGLGAVQIVREMADKGLALTDAGGLQGNNLYRLFRKRLLLGEREITVGGESYRLLGYYPPILTDAAWDTLQLAVDRRKGKRGVGEIPSIITGMGITVCGYCGAAMVAQNLMGRRRQDDGKPWPGHRRLICTSHANGHGCPMPGSIQAAPVERALMLYAADAMRMDVLLADDGGGQSLRAELAAARRRLADADAKLDRLKTALLEDNGAVPLVLVREMRTLEAEAASCRAGIERGERELAGIRPASPDLARKWLELFAGVEALDHDARMQARELVRASFSRVVLWHSEDVGCAFDLELSLRGGGARRMRFDRKSGGLLD